MALFGDLIFLSTAEEDSNESGLCIMLYALFTCWSRSAAIMVVWTFFFLLFSIPLYVLLLYGQMMRVNDEVEERWQAA
jgi:succinate-acetate transporter protein